MVKRNKILIVKHKTYSTYIFLTDYDEKLPMYFNNNFQFSQRKMPQLIENTKNGLLEKQRIKWFSVKELKTDKTFRPFYQEIVDKITGKLPVISEKVKARIQKVKQTKKNKKN